jgi:pimeloyl-ACP methyl ester carboxylesterase
MQIFIHPLHAKNTLQLQKEKDILKEASIENVFIYPKKNSTSDETLKRHAVLTKYKDAAATIVFCHGFLCDKYDIACFRNMFPVGQYNFLTFDFRGHGQDTQGQISTLGHDEALDVIAAAQFVREHPDLKDKPVFAWSFSMGGVAAIIAQAHHILFDAMIFDCAFDSTEKLIKQGFNQMRFSLFGYTFDIPGRSLLEKYALHPYVQSFLQKMLKVCVHWDTKHVHLQAIAINPVESMAQISVPCFFIHCINDEKVPLESAHALYNSAKGYKRLWITQGRRHFDSFFYNPERYAYKVRKFLDQVLHNTLSKEYAKIINDVKNVT